jgi:hypothetical protein
MEYVVKTKVGWLKMLVFSSPADSQIAITQYPAYAFHMQEPLATATADVLRKFGFEDVEIEVAQKSPTPNDDASGI